jgi:integrase
LDDVRLHDLRHSFASGAAEAGLPLLVIGKMLGHKQAATTARYAHLGDDPIKRAADSTAGAISRAMAGTKPTPVTPLKKKGSA